MPPFLVAGGALICNIISSNVKKKSLFISQTNYKLSMEQTLLC